MRHNLFKPLAITLIYILTSATISGCGTASRTQPIAASDPDAFHKSMRSLSKVTNSEVGSYAVSLTDELYATLNDRSIVNSIVLERYKEEATIKLFMDDEACFGTGGSTPKKECAAQLQKLGGLLSTYHQTTIQILGHTVNGGAKSQKTALSRHRAEAISSAFAKQGLSGKRVVASGAGTGKPVFSNDTASGRQLNNRIELVINIIKEPVAKTTPSSNQGKPRKTDSTTTTVKPLIKATTT